jgi:hypothetical protein
LLGKYFQATGALNAANKIAQGTTEVDDRIKMLAEKVVGVEMRSDLKEIIEKALKKLEAVQNGI